MTASFIMTEPFSGKEGRMNMEFSHVGIVVPNLEEAREELTRLLGLEWHAIRENDVPIRRDDGREQIVHFRVSFSTQAPHFELIEEVPGTVWVRNEHSNIHHVAFAASSLEEESHRLATAQCPLEVTRVGDQVPDTFAYHRGALGVRVEVMPRTVQLAEGGRA
jgi:catechol 2,3-dioxygenase-like lactoylglutathione lyase family enzyme